MMIVIKIMMLLLIKFKEEKYIGVKLVTIMVTEIIIIVILT